MLKLSWISFIFQSIPESIGLIVFCFALLKQNINWPLIIKIGIIQSFVILVIRSFPISFGVHSIIILMLMVSQLVYFTKISPLSAFKASFIAFIFLGIAEVIFNELLLMFLNLSFEQAFSNQWLWAAIGLPQALSMYILALTINYFNNAKRSKENSC